MAAFFVTLNVVSNGAQPSFPLNPAERSPRLLPSVPLVLFNSGDTQTSALHAYLSLCSPTGECPTWAHHPGPGCHTVPVVPYSSKTTQSPKYPSPYPLTLPILLPSWDHLHCLFAFPSLLGTHWRWTLPSSSSGSSPRELFPALRAVGDLLSLLRR